MPAEVAKLGRMKELDEDDMIELVERDELRSDDAKCGMLKMSESFYWKESREFRTETCRPFILPTPLHVPSIAPNIAPRGGSLA